jgi:hypothetical protein
MVRVLVFALLVVASRDIGAGADANTLRLVGLDARCGIVRRWIGVVPRIPYGDWLKCQSDEFLITGPMSLMGHVRLRDENSVLGFVRFFTMPSAERYIRPEGMVEIMPAQGGAGEFNKMPVKRFDRVFSRIRVKRLPPLTTDSMRMFTVQRVMLTPMGQAIYVTETVGETGYYEIVSRQTLIRDASKVGLYYLEQ